MTGKEMAKLTIQALEDKKAEDIKVIDISEVSVIADYFIIANGSNRSQIQALSDHVEETLGKAGVPLRQVEGYNNANWVLLDFHDVIVHIFDKENRLFYGPDLVNRSGDRQGVMVHFEGSAGQGGKNKILPQIVPGVRDHNHSPFSSGMGLIRSITTNRFPPCIRPKSTQSPLIKALCTLNFFLPL